jgi:uncharacterized damage-inducible protein DinB
VDLLPHLRRLFAYDHWANRQALASLRAAKEPPREAVDRLAHVLAAEEGWLARLEAKPFTDFWPDATLDALALRIEAMHDRWTEFLSDPNAQALTRSIDYVNSRGERYTSRVADVLLHVVLHSSYHRGQVATDLRREGATPALTDYVHATRRGLVP